MKNGIYRNKYDIFNEIKTFLLIFICYLITIINPISWIVYIIIYKIGTTAGEDKNTIRMVSQWISFLISTFSYIILIGYLIFKVIEY